MLYKMKLKCGEVKFGIYDTESNKIYSDSELERIIISNCSIESEKIKTIEILNRVINEQKIADDLKRINQFKREIYE